MATVTLPNTTQEATGTAKYSIVKAAEIIAAGTPLTIHTDGLAYVSSANSAIYSRVDGVAVVSAQIGQWLIYALPGQLLTTSGLTLGDSYYLAGGTNEVQTLTITGTPTGGTVQLGYGGQTTAAIAYNADAATVQAALEALSSIGSGNVVCGGGAWPAVAITVTFQADLGGQNVALITLEDNSLTGGTSPTLTPTETTPGARGGGLAPRADQTTGDYLTFMGVAKATTSLEFDPKVIGLLA